MKKILTIIFCIFAFSSYAIAKETTYNKKAFDKALSEGKIVVVEFMNINCGACQAYAPYVESLYETYGPNGTNQIELIAIEINSSTENTECESYMNEQNASYPLLNGQNAAYYGYEVYYTPTFYIIYPDNSYTNFCSNVCVNSTSIGNLVNDIGDVINGYFPLNSPWFPLMSPNSSGFPRLA